MTFRRRQLLATTLLTAASLLATASTALAQEAPAADSTEVEELVVTGTRIRVQDYTSSNPVATVTGDTIEQAGVTNLTDFLTDMPALVSSTTLQDNSNAGDRAQVGLNVLNLRNLGTQRTLVLVDGRRHVAASVNSMAVDVNTIPIGLIERVEVLTGGASAIYGADGVSGVVNFVLKDNFEGLDARFQGGWSPNGGGENVFGSLLWGKNFAGGRGNVTLAGEYSDTKRLGAQDRSFSSLAGAEGLVTNPNYPATSAFQRVFSTDTRYIDTSPGGSIYADIYFGSIFGDPGSLSGVDYQGDGTPWVDGRYSSGFTMVGGSGSQTAAFITDLIPGLERWSINGTGSYEFSPMLRLFGEAKFVETKTQFLSQPSFDYALYVPIDNPYIPANVVTAASDPSEGIATYIGGVLVARDNFDLGFVTRDVTRETSRFVVGAEGDFTDSLRYEISLNYGKTKETNIESNNRINERWFAAIDAVDEGQFLTGTPNGNIVCRSNLDPLAVPLGTFPGFGDTGFDPDTWGSTFTPGANSGCQPANIFGDGNMSPQALDWILTESTSIGEVEQFVVNGFLSGDTTPWFSLPAGPISFAVGAEYRREEAKNTPSDLELLGGELEYDVTWLGQGQISGGKFDVSEAFAEISAPLLADLPFAQQVTFDAAFRYSDYSTIGETEASKLGLKWQVNDWVMFRATQAKAVRAPDISELFQPQLQTFATLDDPCDDQNYDSGPSPAVREANCRAALGYGPTTPYTFNNTSSSSIEGVVGGNPDLDAEDAETFTVGFVFTPQKILPGFSFALDYYDITLENAIQFFSAQSIVDKCYDLPQPNQFCSLVSRSPSNNFIDFFEQFGVNVASYETTGWDYSIRYVFDPMRFGVTRDIGRFGISVVGNKLETLTFTEDPTDPSSIDDDVGEAFAPEWQANADLTWEWNKWFVNYGFNYFSETTRSAYVGRPANYVDPRYRNYEHRATHDVQLRYTVQDGVELYGGINNLTDQRPARGATDYPVGPLGKFIYLGAKLKL